MSSAVAVRRSRHAVLELDDVSVSSEDQGRVDRMHGNLHGDSGELVLVQVADLRQAEIWADVATGLLVPGRGRVSILGNALAGLDMETGNWLRGRIGRVFSRGNWLDRLSLMDNILIQARHHSGRSDEDLKREASALAESFDLPGVPLGMPGRFTRIEQQRAACVRAFLGNPVLVILEDPTYGAHAEMLRTLVGAIRTARNRGAAVIWFSPSMDIWRDRSIPVSRRYRMAGRELMEIGAH